MSDFGNAREGNKWLDLYAPCVRNLLFLSAVYCCCYYYYYSTIRYKRSTVANMYTVFAKLSQIIQWLISLFNPKNWLICKSKIAAMTFHTIRRKRRLCLKIGWFTYSRLPIYIPIYFPFVYIHIVTALSIHFLAPAVTVGETDGAMDSASVLFFTSSFAYNFARK